MGHRSHRQKRIQLGSVRPARRPIREAPIAGQRQAAKHGAQRGELGVGGHVSNGYLGKFDEGIGFSTRAFFVDQDEYTFEKFHPQGRVNQRHVNDSQWTQLVTKGPQELDRAERKKVMDEAQKLNAEQCYYVHQVAANVFYPPDPRLKNFRHARAYGFEELFETWMET